MLPPPPRSTLFPYTTLFRSRAANPRPSFLSTRRRPGPRRQVLLKLASLTGVHPSHARPTWAPGRDRESTRLNSSHVEISYAVFCLKKKKPPVITTGRASAVP